MSRPWKVVLLAVLVLPVLAYAAGALTATSPREPAPRPPILLEDPRGDVSPGATLSPSAPPTSSPSSDDDDDDDDDDGVTVIRPDIGEDDDDDDDDHDDDDDDGDDDEGDDD
ncbi:hypothetical protein NOK12_30520 [Nocardioides sp. OK12]|uniref:hypothetical protein n=1 Tax=Nocardioides sp. OK12 TaxID=2758661 RepID=UPI0021C48A5C|nr:hypothetical protein [Nocardioides sp. OK12]GHJ60534.1 hypothetical protein NOK12_30520 [Nocardioides sp. OK12]